jgi:hypothetical protein
MITKRVHCDAAYFQVFAARIISANERLRFIAHRLFNCTLARDGGPARGFGATTCFEDLAPVLGFNPSQLCSSFTLIQRPM